MFPLFGFNKTLTSLLGIGVLQVLLFAGLIFVTPASGAEVNATAGEGVPRIQIDKEFVDYGKVPIEQKVEHLTIVRNVGDAPLEITNLCHEHAGMIHTKVLEGC